MYSITNSSKAAPGNFRDRLYDIIVTDTRQGKAKTAPTMLDIFLIILLCRLHFANEPFKSHHLPTLRLAFLQLRESYLLELFFHTALPPC